jgi:hypothetical protein
MNRLQGTIVIGLVLGLGVAACSSSSPSPAAKGGSTASPPGSSTTVLAAPSSTTAPPSASTSVPAPSPASTSTAPPNTAAAVPSAVPGRCQTSQLEGSLSEPNGTAGSIYYKLVLTNKGPTTCVLDGYPGVSFVTGNQGQQVGAPANRLSGTVSPVTLAPGASSSATLQITDAGDYSPCGTTPTDGLRVYPPNELASLLIVHSDQTCSDPSKITLHVGPFQS